MKGEELVESIKQLSPEQQNVLGLNPEEFQDDLYHLTEVQGQIDELQIPIHQLRIQSSSDDKPNQLSSSHHRFFTQGPKKVDETSYLLHARANL